MNLSFAGCGFLGIYHVGVAVCFKKYAPHLLLEKISGASAGAIAACCLLCDLPLGEITSDVLRVITVARSKTLGPFSPSFNVQDVLLEGLEKVLPEDAHIRVSGKLHISLTRVYDGRNVIVSHFTSKEDLLQALLASSFIPMFSGILPPRFHGVRYMDGGFSNNLPTLDENTITVSPFCGESDICPRDLSSQLFHVNVANTSIELSKQNIYRFTRILFPPKPEVLSNMCKQGFDDALRFLHRNNLINCTRCLAVQSTFTMSETLDENFDFDPHCNECKQHRQEALVANLPDTVMTIFQEAIDSANKGIINWVFKHRGMKILSILSLPCILPADIVYATYTKFMASAPKVGHNLWLISKYMIEHLSHLIHNVNKKRQQLSANITCQMAITEYRGTKFDLESAKDYAYKNKMNFNFTLNLEEGEVPRDQSSAMKFNNKVLGQAPLRRPSLNAALAEPGTTLVDDDTFDHILQVTSHHDAVMAFYYMDENNKVKVTEIFDVTDTDSPAILCPEEREAATQLEFDEDNWDVDSSSALNDSPDGNWLGGQEEMLMPDDVPGNVTLIGALSTIAEEHEGRSSCSSGEESCSLEYLLDRDSSTIFSDPESEWNQHQQNEKASVKPAHKSKTPLHACSSNSSATSGLCPDSRPESDQSKEPLSEISRKPAYVAMDS
ncbi:1-acylglycerol-3-phosphate O-acyltransferase Pnpla3-like isoform X3 [Ischnura elegans]|uniref:1-acylglycerol-3-phosphate O-acyltransferase Pnpla3-like isoform X3 n=1 Tax=Ischnura elegans TaxID=197161 RepID=UPI001ED89188|nr:1-acylglycerol-3-phosphate O-acyltransferase Pnpla3-like isoform X3 [Ischnura elegans]